MINVQKHMRIIKTCNLYLSFFSLGLGVSLTGPCLLDLQRIVNTDTQHIALIYTARSTGFLVGAIFGGILLDVVKSKQAVLTVSNIFTTATTFAIPWSRNFETLMGLMVINGMSLGAIETGGNVICLQLWGKDSDPFFQALHFTYGLGGLISPLIAAPFLSNHRDVADNITYPEQPFNFSASLSDNDNGTFQESTGNITYPFSIVGAFAFLVTILLLVVCIISPTEDGRPQSEKQCNENRSYLFMFGTVILTFLLFFIAAGTEIGYAQTLTAYAVKGPLKVTTSVGSYMTSAFWAAFTVSRLASIFLAIKISNLKLIISDICIVAISALMLLFLMPNEWTLWTASVIFGAGIASCYPAMVGWVATHINITNKISATFAVGCAAGEMVVPFVIAYFMEKIPEVFAYVTAACSVLLSFFLIILYCIFKKGTKKCTSKETECYDISSRKVDSYKTVEYF